MGNSHSLQDTCFDMKMASKQMERDHAKCLKNEQVQKSKVKSAIEKADRKTAKKKKEEEKKNQNIEG